MGSNLRISHLSFADDLMVFYDGKESSLQGIIQTLDNFHRLSGLVMNREKTSLFTAGLSQSQQQQSASLGFQHGSFPVRYLGLPLMHRKLQVKDYSPLLDTLEKRFSGWAVKMLSFSGRLQLVKSVIYGTLNFWFSAFILPKACIKKIEQLCSWFLWSGNILKTTKAKVSWKTLCLPREEGGLGLRDLRTWNKILSLKLVWLLFSASGSLWVAWMKQNHLAHTSYWDYNDNKQGSWIWKQLISLRPLARKFLSCCLGNGNTASFWFDDWSPLGPLFEMFGESGPRQIGVHRAGTVSQACNTFGWKLRPARSNKAEELHIHLASINPPSHSDKDDVFLWRIPGAEPKKFSSKDTWDFIRSRESIKEWFKAVWFKGHIPRHAFTFWTANLDRLPVRTRLRSWGMNISPTCPLCDVEEETRDHLFINCTYSKDLWFLILTKLGQQRLTLAKWDDLIEWMLAKSQGQSTLLKKITAQATIYTIWKERNARVHEGALVPSKLTFRSIDRTVRDKLLSANEVRRFEGLLSEWFTYS